MKSHCLLSKDTMITDTFLEIVNFDFLRTVLAQQIESFKTADVDFKKIEQDVIKAITYSKKGTITMRLDWTILWEKEETELC